MNWEEKILKDYQNWFIKFRKNKKYWPKNCDIQFDRSISQIRKFIRKSEKEVYLKIDSEITSKKQDRAILTKAKRLAKGNTLDAKYIDLRFGEIWEDIIEDEIQPFIGSFMHKIINEQLKYEKKNKSSGLGMFSGYDSEKTSG